MNPPLVTAIIPVYNRAWCIRRAVESVLAQTYRPLELIVVDDGSDDETPKILSALSESAHPDIDLQLIRQENRGVSAARNAAISEAKGEWIALLDSDDEWLPEKTTRQVEQLIAEDLRINQTGETWVRRGVRVNPPKRLLKQEGDLFERCLDHCAISPSAVMMQRSLFDEVGLFDEDYPACEDYEMWLRIASHYRVGLVREEMIIKHGGHEDQLSFTIPALDQYRIRALAKTLGAGLLSDAQTDMAKKVLTTKAKIYIQGCEKRGREKEADDIRRLLKTIV